MSMEDDLIAMMATVKRQQAAIDGQMQLMNAAINTLRTERDNLSIALEQTRTIPKTTLETLTNVTKVAAGEGVENSITEEKDALKDAVNAAITDLKKFNENASTAAIKWGLIGSALGCMTTGLIFWYALSFGVIKSPSITLDAQQVANYLKDSLPPKPATKPASKH